MPASREDWKRVGASLIDRRIDISPRYANRRLFADETGLNWRLLYDAEHGRRATFKPETVRAFESAYRLVPGSLERSLAGGDLEPLPESRSAPVPLRPVAPPAADPAEEAAEEILARVLPRYKHDEVAQAIGAQHGKTALTRVLELRHARNPDLDRDALAVLLDRCRDDEVAQTLGRRGGIRDAVHVAEVLDWLGSRYPYPRDAEENNGTVGLAPRRAPDGRP